MKSASTAGHVEADTSPSPWTVPDAVSGAEPWYPASTSETGCQPPADGQPVTRTAQPRLRECSSGNSIDAYSCCSTLTRHQWSPDTSQDVLDINDCMGITDMGFLHQFGEDDRQQSATASMHVLDSCSMGICRRGHAWMQSLPSAAVAGASLMMQLNMPQPGSSIPHQGPEPHLSSTRWHMDDASGQRGHSLLKYGLSLSNPRSRVIGAVTDLRPDCDSRSSTQVPSRKHKRPAPGQDGAQCGETAKRGCSDGAPGMPPLHSAEPSACPPQQPQPAASRLGVPQRVEITDGTLPVSDISGAGQPVPPAGPAVLPPPLQPGRADGACLLHLAASVCGQGRSPAEAEEMLAPVALEHPGRVFFVCPGEAQPLRFEGGRLAALQSDGAAGTPVVQRVAVFMKRDGCAVAVEGVDLVAAGQPSVLHSLPEGASVFEPLRLLGRSAEGYRLVFAPPQYVGRGAVVTLRLQRGTAFSSSFLLPTEVLRPRSSPSSARVALEGTRSEGPAAGVPPAAA